MPRVIEVTKDEWRRRDGALGMALHRIGEARSACINEQHGYEAKARDRIRLAIGGLIEVEARLAQLEAANG